jgi:hypothetical protein
MKKLYNLKFDKGDEVWLASIRRNEVYGPYVVEAFEIQDGNFYDWEGGRDKLVVTVGIRPVGFDHIVRAKLPNLYSSKEEAQEALEMGDMSWLKDIDKDDEY